MRNSNFVKTSQVEAYTFTDDFKIAVVICPVCAKEHEVTAGALIANTEQAFAHHTWYTFACGCEQNISFMLSFPVVTMIAGERYTVVKPAHSFGEIDGELVNFEETRMDVEVLPKPVTVLVCDGHSETTEPLPSHLAQDDWYAVKYVCASKNKVKPIWLNTKGCQVLPFAGM